MEQYISKDALVAEIESKLDMLAHLKYIASNYNDEKTLFAVEKQIEQYESLISFLNTIVVKEVDLEKEIDSTYHNYVAFGRQEIATVAKHFFELGLKAAQKGE